MGHPLHHFPQTLHDIRIPLGFPSFHRVQQLFSQHFFLSLLLDQGTVDLELTAEFDDGNPIVFVHVFVEYLLSHFLGLLFPDLEV